jgi:hypothetical protein
MKRWQLIVGVVVLASAVGFAQGGRGGAGQAGRGGQGRGGGGGGGGRGVESTAALTVIDGWGVPIKDPLAGGKQPGPAPMRDISGMWEPASGPGGGIQANGAYSLPSDGKTEPPYTPEGKRVYDSHGALYGYRAVLPSLSNDPRNHCDPLGFPRSDFYQLRHTEILQSPTKTHILYQYDKRYRVIWTDGRDFPKELPDTRWYGFSIGKWADNTTFVVNTIGLVGEPKKWLDETGRPMSDQTKVEERFHRVNANRLEITVTVDDPKYTSKPYVAMDKFPMKLQTPDYDVVEMLCIPSDMEAYSRDFGDPASGLVPK